MIEQRPALVESAGPTLQQTRERLAREWADRSPEHPEAIAEFYRTTKHLAADLDAWHRTPERESWTQMLVHVARESGAKRIIDIGAGAGHDLRALRDALPDVLLTGVEPNQALRERLLDADGINGYSSVDYAFVEAADLLVCVDVLEHVVDPETFLGTIAQRAPVGCWLFETCPTHDHSTPLHLEANRGWQPGRVLERHGWRLQDAVENHVRVWRRLAKEGRQTASLLLCSYREIATKSVQAIMHTVQGSDGNWRVTIKNGDADIGRSRAIIATQWYHSTNDDVFLMIDSDITFKPADADHVVELCRAGYDIVCGAYPVHNGEHLSLRCLPGQDSVEFGTDKPPLEVMYAATGFMAVHRRVIDALVKTMPLCHAYESWGFYPLFQQPVIRDPDVGGWARLSEDWGFCHLAREHGFRVWMDPTVKLGHQSTFDVSVSNMGLVLEASRRI